MKLNLGSGKTLIPGYINIDILNYGQEIHRDISRGLPFGDGSISEIYTSHFLEHLHAGGEVEFVMSEIWRVLKPNSKLRARMPHSTAKEAIDIAHHSYWDEIMLKSLLSSGERQTGKHAFNFWLLKTSREGIDFLFELQALKLRIYNVVDRLYSNYIAVKVEG